MMEQRRRWNSCGDGTAAAMEQRRRWNTATVVAAVAAMEYSNGGCGCGSDGRQRWKAAMECGCAVARFPPKKAGKIV